MTPHHTSHRLAFQGPGPLLLDIPHPDCGPWGSGPQPAVLDKTHLSLLGLQGPLGGGGMGESRCPMRQVLPVPGFPSWESGGHPPKWEGWGIRWAPLPHRGLASARVPTFSAWKPSPSCLPSSESRVLLHPLTSCMGSSSPGRSVLSSWHRPSSEAVRGPHPQ